MRRLRSPIRTSVLITICVVVVASTQARSTDVDTMITIIEYIERTTSEIATFYEFDVLDTVKGQLAETAVTAVAIGGQIGALRHIVEPPMPTFEVGDEAILFLGAPNPRGYYSLSMYSAVQIAKAGLWGRFVEWRPDGLLLYRAQDGSRLRTLQPLPLEDFVFSLQRLE